MDIDPLARLEREPNVWYDRFIRFAVQGARRSVLGVYRQELGEQNKSMDAPTAPKAWYKAANAWHWRERAEAWDRQERERLRAEWTQRRAELRDREWAQAEALFAKAEAMLAFPVAREERQDEDGKTVILEPADWKFADAAKIVETASRLARLAAELETERAKTEVSGTMKRGLAGLDLSQLSEQELAFLLAVVDRLEAGGKPRDPLPGIPGADQGPASE